MRILHTSDWHIGRQFHNVSLLDDQQYILNQLLELVRDAAIDVLVIAGDIYDRSVPAAEAVVLLNNTLRTLCVDMSVQVVMISGNHDGAERLGFGAELLKSSGLHIISDLRLCIDPVVIEANGETVRFFGIPYCTPELVKHTFQVDVKTFDQAHSYLVNEITTQMNTEVNNVLISHCFVGGAEESESERPLSIGGADTVSWEPMRPFSYVALGHLHAPQYRGEEYIRYSGSLIKYSFSEVNQNKGVYIVDVSEGQSPVIEKAALKAKRGMRVIEGEFNSILTAAFEDLNKDDYLLVRLTDKKSILDAVGKLRGVYPNLLHLEKPGMLSQTEVSQLAKEQLKRSEFELFADFFEQTLQEPMNELQTDALKGVISAIHSEGEGE